MRTFQLWFWGIWAVIMTAQAARSVVEAINEPIGKWKVLWLGAAFVYGFFAFASVAMVRKRKNSN